MSRFGAFFFGVLGFLGCAMLVFLGVYIGLFIRFLGG